MGERKAMIVAGSGMGGIASVLAMIDEVYDLAEASRGQTIIRAVDDPSPPASIPDPPVSRQVRRQRERAQRKRHA